jgi:hypothetical protein
MAALNGNGINWESIYGEKWSEMTTEQKDVAIVSMFSQVNKTLIFVSDKIETSAKENLDCHKRYDKAFWMAVLGIPALATIVTIIATTLINHIGQ